MSTRSELEMVSETTEAVKPIRAWRASFWSGECGRGKISER